MQGFKVLSVNISEKKGTVKHPVTQIKVNEKGVENDAHAGMQNRNISLLGIESFRKFELEANRKLSFGEFAENITTEGIELFKANPLDCFESNNIVLEVTQIGKKCHGDRCNIFREVGNCVMPKEGIFVRVKKNGIVSAGDFFEYKARIFKILVLTLSDRAAAGEYEDKSGPRLIEHLTKHFALQNRLINIQYQLIPDSIELLEEYIRKLSEEKYDLFFTTGGTGIGPRDITVDVIKKYITKEIPGIMDLIRFKYGAEKPQVLVSRSVAGLIDQSLTFTLPGSTKAVDEYMTEILKSLNHLIYMLNGLDIH